MMISDMYISSSRTLLPTLPAHCRLKLPDVSTWSECLGITSGLKILPP